jgi:hypothetical protein
MMNFLRQIPYVKTWVNREVTHLKYLMKTEKFTRPGIVLAQEGSTCDKIFIMIDGQYEIVKKDLTNVFYNDTVGTVAVMESNKRNLVKSEYKIRPEDIGIKGSLGKNYQYIGSEINMMVMEMIAKVYDKSRPFSVANRSKFNQPIARELNVNIISKGQTFGDTDASRYRNYMYTLRTSSNSGSYYWINTVEFMNHVA